MSIREQLFKIMCIVLTLLTLIIFWYAGIWWAISFAVGCIVFGFVIVYKVDQGIKEFFGNK